MALGIKRPGGPSIQEIEASTVIQHDRTARDLALIQAGKRPRLYGQVELLEQRARLLAADQPLPGGRRGRAMNRAPDKLRAYYGIVGSGLVNSARRKQATQ